VATDQNEDDENLSLENWEKTGWEALCRSKEEGRRKGTCATLGGIKHVRALSRDIVLGKSTAALEYMGRSSKGGKG